MQLKRVVPVVVLTLSGMSSNLLAKPLPYPNPVPNPSPKVEVKMLNGSPALFLDGKPLSGLMAVPSVNWGTGDLPVVRNGILILTNRPGSYAYRSVTTTATFGTRYIAEVALTPVKDTGQGSGVSLSIQVKGSNSYLLGLAKTTNGGAANLWKEEANSKNSDRKWITVPFDWKMGTTYLLRLTIDGSTVKGFIDGKPIGTHTEKNPVPVGKVQVSVYHCIADVDSVEVKNPNGKTVFQDDFSIPRPQDWSGQPLSAAKDFAQSGIHVYTSTGWGGTEIWSGCWKGPGQYDFAKLDRTFTILLEQDPLALFLPRLYLDPPAWWLELHPQEASIFYSPAGWSSPDKRASFTSELWRKDTGEYLRQYIRHLNSVPYGKHILGFAFGGGAGLEWVYNWNPYFHDYGPCQIQAFRQWLRKKYSTVTALRDAWQDPKVTFETAAIPTPRQRQTASNFEYYDPARGRQVCDYLRFHSFVVADAIKYFAHIMKEETQGKKLVLAFYGYHLGATDPIIMKNIGHHDLAGLLDCPDIDAFGSPHEYTDRQAGGATLSPTPFDSVLLHNKLFFDEDDIRTHLAPSNMGEGRTHTLAQTIGVMKRDFACFLSKGASLWWMDWGNGWYNDNALMAVVEKIQQIAMFALTQDRRPSSQIAMIVSQRSLDYLRTAPPLIAPLLGPRFLDGLARIGSPYDVLLASDLGRAREYRFYIFLDTFYLTLAERQIIRQKVLTHDHTVLWMVAPGYVTDKGLSVEAVRDLTGIALATAPMEAECSAVLTSSKDRLTRKLAPGLTWRADHGAYGPIFYCNDPEAKTLALLHAVQPTNGKIGKGNSMTKPGLVVKAMPGWRSIWCGVPNIPSALVRNIAQTAGVHLYDENDGDVVYANRFMVAVHTRQAGPRTIHLPTPATVTDAFSGRTIAKNVTEFTATLGQYETGFWLLERKE